MPTVKARAAMILGELEQAQTELIGKAVILTDGKAGTVECVLLDEMHGLRIRADELKPLVPAVAERLV
jgi:hypothetical protein